MARRKSKIERLVQRITKADDARLAAAARTHAERAQVSEPIHPKTMRPDEGAIYTQQPVRRVSDAMMHWLESLPDPHGVIAKQLSLARAYNRRIDDGRWDAERDLHRA